MGLVNTTFSFLRQSTYTIIGKTFFNVMMYIIVILLTTSAIVALIN